MQFLRQKMRICMHPFRRREKLHFMIYTVDIYNDFAGSYSLNFQGIEPGKFKVRPKMASDIRIHNSFSQRGQPNANAFSGAGILCYPADRSAGNNDLVFGITPFCLGCNGIPKHPQAVSFASYKFFLYGRIHGTHFCSQCIQIYVKALV